MFCFVTCVTRVIQVSAAVKAAGDGDARSVMQFLNSGGDINAKCKTGAR